MDGPRLILHAPNVHQGGGKTLLLALLSALPEARVSQLILDARLDTPLPLPAGLPVRRVRPRFLDRFQAERRLVSQTAADSHVICFSGLPPLFRCAGRVSVFVQNRLLLESANLNGFPWKQRWRIRVERQWFRRCASHATDFIVQTESMRRLLHECLGPEVRSQVLPLVPQELSPAAPHSSADSHDELRLLPFRQSTATRPEFDFCYVASGEPHKNHRTLIEAWMLLAREGVFPSLCLTLSATSCRPLLQWIERCRDEHGLRIENRGQLTPEQIAEVYRNSRALVYPSLCESFGLPLLEARQHGLPIVAAELDYVRDVVSPVETFDPHSPRSLARAICRVQGPTAPQPALLPPQAFFDQLRAA